MDEVQVDFMIQKYKDNGELISEDPALLMLLNIGQTVKNTKKTLIV